MPRRVLLQSGFGLGHAFLRTWQGWRDDPDRAARLDFIALTPTPPDAGQLRRAHHDTPLAPLAQALAASWPPRTPNLHRLGFDAGRVHLLLAVGDTLALLPQLQAQVDEFLIDELDLSADPQRAATRCCKGLARLAAPNALLRGAAARQLRPALASVGFEPVAGAHGLEAAYRPRFVPRRRTPRIEPDAERHALIVGAGLAGCATAAALAEQGWRCTLIERHAAPALEGSGNPAGLLHGVVHVQDGVHARWHRAAALAAQRVVQQAIDEGSARGSLRGLLRLERSGKSAAQMADELQALQLPADYAQALDAQQASARAGLPLRHPAWFYPGAGWVQPAALARALLRRAGTAAEFRGHLAVQALRRDGERWALLDADGRAIDASATLVLANAWQALRLLDATHWPVQQVRGQISLWPQGGQQNAGRLRLPALPVVGAGYLLPEIDGQAVFGASAQPGDDDACVREADHDANLQRLRQLCDPPWLPPSGQLQGRVGWRCAADDRLPLLGAAPDEGAARQRRTERLSDVPRRRGLYLFSGLGSRGIGSSVLGAQVLAAQLSGAPWPLEASLGDALDPARFTLRARRRGTARG